MTSRLSKMCLKIDWFKVNLPILGWGKFSVVEIGYAVGCMKMNSD
jgi:hypothetical protein